jgi:PleD family two-component response regulator
LLGLHGDGVEFAAYAGRRKQILVADDEANIRRVLSAQLQADGYDVHEVGDGAARPSRP